MTLHEAIHDRRGHLCQEEGGGGGSTGEAERARQSTGTVEGGGGGGLGGGGAINRCHVSDVDIRYQTRIESYLAAATLEETWGLPLEPPTGEEAVGTAMVDHEVTAAQVVWTTGTTVTEGPAGTGATEVGTGAGALDQEELPTGETPPAGTEGVTMEVVTALPVAPTPVSVERAGQSVTVGAQEVMVTSSVW
jgi:hypothetical protein